MSTRLRYVSEYSRHADPAVALGEALGGVVERIGTSPDLAVVFVCGAAAQFMPQIADAIHTLLCPTVLLGATGQAIISGPELDTGSGVTIWAGNPGLVRPARMEITSSNPAVGADEAFIGLRSPQAVPHSSSPHARLWLDDEGYQDGQVGFYIRQSKVRVARARGFRPVGEALAVTELGNGSISRLAAETAEVTMQGIIAGLTAEERAMAALGLSLGVVRDEYLEEFGPGDFSILQLRGTNSTGSLVAQDAKRLMQTVSLGSIVQFHVADPSFAVFDSDDLGHFGAGDHGALILAKTGQALPDTTNFHENGIGAIAGLVTESDDLLLPEITNHRPHGLSGAGLASGAAAVLFH